MTRSSPAKVGERVAGEAGSLSGERGFNLSRHPCYRCLGPDGLIGRGAMRSLFVVLPLFAATPAFAQDAAPPAPLAAPSVSGAGLAAAARALSDPQVQRGVAAIVAALSDTVLATRVGPLATVDPSIRPDDTLGSMTERDDPGFHDRVARGTEQAVGTAGNVASAAAGMAAELNATAERLRRALAAARP